MRERRRVALCVCAICALLSGDAHADASIAQLLRPAPQRHDVTHELSWQLSSIERRAFANDPEVQRALARVRSELAALQSARVASTKPASPADLQRHIALVWAALSWADRAEARAKTAAALAGLAARAEAAEAAALRALEALERMREPPRLKDPQ